MMSKQMQLFSNRATDSSFHPPTLLEQTHELFGTCSSSELIQRILAATEAINEQCAKPVCRSRRY